MIALEPGCPPGSSAAKMLRVRMSMTSGLPLLLTKSAEAFIAAGAHRLRSTATGSARPRRRRCVRQRVSGVGDIDEADMLRLAVGADERLAVSGRGDNLGHGVQLDIRVPEHRDNGDAIEVALRGGPSRPLLRVAGSRSAVQS
jgi:hypothetical protein